GGGGADFAELTLIAAMLVRGMLIYSGGITKGAPFLHFGAVSARRPEGLYAERCVKLGENIAEKAVELFA
ncbi:MAG: flavodoxin, partial [Candidatus Latescibacteria bacterium]|nr:flavodoxin [Candidatus Latescibacterota bacterium]